MNREQPGDPCHGAFLYVFTPPLGAKAGYATDPLLFQAGSTEMLLSHSRKAFELARAAGTHAVLSGDISPVTSEPLVATTPPRPAKRPFYPRCHRRRSGSRPHASGGRYRDRGGMPRHSRGPRPISARLTPSKRDRIKRRIAASAQGSRWATVRWTKTSPLPTLEFALRIVGTRTLRLGRYERDCGRT